MDELLRQIQNGNLKEVVISFRNTQDIDADQKDYIDFTTDGLYSFQNGCGSLTYFESDVTGMAGTKTNIRIDPDEVTLNREGTVTSTMTFREGNRNSFLYTTPYGSAILGIQTRSIRKNFDENGGRMEIDYVMDFEHAVALRSNIELSVKPLKM